jgi:hypothetical protein
MGDCSAVLAELVSLNSSLLELQAAYAEATAPAPDPCVTGEPAEYSIALHVGCIFTILVVSVLGTVIPILGSHRSKFAVHPFVLILGKCCATGVILACALIHMLQPSAESLTSTCLPEEFHDRYPSYAFLFAMVAALGMQLLEDVVERCLSARSQQLADLPPRSQSGDGTELVEAQAQPGGDGGHSHSHGGHSHGGHDRGRPPLSTSPSVGSPSCGRALLLQGGLSQSFHVAAPEQQHMSVAPVLDADGADGVAASAPPLPLPPSQPDSTRPSFSVLLAGEDSTRPSLSVPSAVEDSGRPPLAVPAAEEGLRPSLTVDTHVDVLLLGRHADVNGGPATPLHSDSIASGDDGAGASGTALAVKPRPLQHPLHSHGSAPVSDMSDAERALVALRHVHVHAGGTVHESKKGTGNARFIIAAILMEVSRAVGGEGSSLLEQ